jgi:hypothetical protein
MAPSAGFMVRGRNIIKGIRHSDTRMPKKDDLKFQHLNPLWTVGLLVTLSFSTGDSNAEPSNGGHGGIGIHSRSLEVGGIGHAVDLDDSRCISVGKQLYKHARAGITCIPSGLEGFAHVNEKLAYVNEKLGDQFDHKTFSCSLTLKENGSIRKLEVVNSSGCAEVDTRGLDLLRAAAPFHRAWGNLEDQTYFVEFPLLSVKRLKPLSH